MELREQGRGIREIARELKMPVSSVFKLLKQTAGKTKGAA
jgi:DNA-binding IclR family transcriptional regulator